MSLSSVRLSKEYGSMGVRPQISNKQNIDDPKAVLDGLSVVSLVDFLRQFGDLSQYAAQVFHGLQEEMSTTASRSRNLMTRMKCVEAALPPLEKTMLSQTSHLQYAYAPGSEWHPCIEDEQSHFIYTDLPHRVMDSYEECREPPRLQLLDKFDPGGPGSCLARYSDPAFFKKVSRNSETLNDVKSNKDLKKRRAWKRSSRQLPYDASNFDLSDKVQSCSPRQLRRPSLTQTASTVDNAFNFKLADQPDSFGSGDWMGSNGSVPHPSASVRSGKTKNRKLSSGSGDELIDSLENHSKPRDRMLEKSGHDSSVFTWDGKVDIAEPMMQNYGMQGLSSLHATSSDFGMQEIDPRMWMDDNDEVQDVNERKSVRWNSRSYEASETNFEVQEVHGKNFKFDEGRVEPFLGEYSWRNRIVEVPETNLKQHDEQGKEPKIEESVTCKSFGGVDSTSSNFVMNQPDDAETEAENFVDALNSIDSEYENDLHCQTKGVARDDLENCMHNDQRAADHVDASTSSSHLACKDSLRRTSALRDISGRELGESSEHSESSTLPFEYDLWQNMNSSLIQDVSSGLNYSVRVDNADGLRQSTAVGEISSSIYKETSLRNWMDEGFFHDPCVPEQSSLRSSNVRSSARGRKGGILGLQPPTPPGFATYSDGVNVNASTTVNPRSQHLGPKDNHLQGNLGSLSRYLSYDNGNTDSSQPTLVSDHHEFQSCDKHGLDRSLTNLNLSAHSWTQIVQTKIPPEDKAHWAADARNSLDGAVPLSDNRSSCLPSLGHHRSHIDDFPGTRSMEYSEKLSSITRDETCDHGNALHSSSTERTLTQETPSCISSAPASPPIDHITISFHPTNSFETAKLKLKVRKGTDHHGEIMDAFPSFQLVPEPNLQPRFNSDTDDDTFCRSNPCISDDVIRDHYGPNSELWDSPGSSESEGPVPHDEFACRTLSKGSLSSSIEHDITANKSIHNGCRPLSDFPIQQAKNPLAFQESEIHSYPKASVDPFDLQELTPALPPLPPLQWRVLKTHSDAVKGMRSTLDATGSLTEPINHGFMLPQTIKPSANVRINASTQPMSATMRNKLLDEQKEIGYVQEKTYKSPKRGVEVDERDDFLHQIREKAFNLRKTGLLKLSPTPVAPVAIGKVAAILEKAKTIRQVMASDEGEDDDHWSDT